MIDIRLVDRNNFFPESLDDFKRYQVVRNVYRPGEDGLHLVYIPFTEDWSPERRREKAREILSGKYVTLCAFDGSRVVGEIMLVPDMNKGRMIVDSLHVSGEYRRLGIGRRLFDAAKAEARARGARALYLSACSAEETIRFYTAMGCRPTEDPIPAYAEDEPCDIQMECAI